MLPRLQESWSLNDAHCQIILESMDDLGPVFLCILGELLKEYIGTPIYFTTVNYTSQHVIKLADSYHSNLYLGNQYCDAQGDLVYSQTHKGIRSK